MVWIPRGRMNVTLWSMSWIVIVVLCGCKVDVASKNPKSRSKAVAKITDPVALSKLALESVYPDVRVMAVGQLTDPVQLVKLAMESDQPEICEKAIAKLPDEAMAKIAVESKNYASRVAAVHRLGDQALLSRIVQQDPLPMVRKIAREKLIRFFAPILNKCTTKRERHLAIAALMNSDPLLSGIAGDMSKTTDDVDEAVARLKLAIQSSIIQSRIRDIKLEVEVQERSKKYAFAPAFDDEYGNPIMGEHITMTLSTPDTSYGKKVWETDFPISVVQGTHFIPVRVRGGELLGELLSHSEFSKDDLIELSRSWIPELREGAISNIHDQTMLLKWATEETNENIREVAVRNCTDQALLAKYIVEEKNEVIRTAAAVHLTSQDVLSKTAMGDEKLAVRLAAMANLTDQASLVELALKSQYPSVRTAACGKITDQSFLSKVAIEMEREDFPIVLLDQLSDEALLSKIAIEARIPFVRRHALMKVTDQAVLARAVLEDKNVEVRRTAVTILTDQTALVKAALGDPDVEVRRGAINNLTDMEALEKASVEDSDVVNRVNAQQRMTLVRKRNSQGTPSNRQ